MSTVNDAVDQARENLRTLHKQIGANIAKQRAGTRADLDEAAAQAQRLAAALRTLAGDQRALAKQQIENAATILDHAAANAKMVGDAAGSEIRQKNTALLQQTREALQSVSTAVAAKRAALSKQHA